MTTKSDELQIDSSVPEDGEFALVIKAKGGSDSDFKPVCYYLLTTLENEEKSMYLYFMYHLHRAQQGRRRLDSFKFPIYIIVTNFS